MITPAVLIMVKLQLKTVALTVHLGYGRKGCIAFAADSHVLIGLTVYHHCAVVIGLTGCIGDKLIPVIHHYINGMHP